MWKLCDTLSGRSLWKSAFALGLDELDRLSSTLRYVTVNQVGTANDRRPARARMTVHKAPLALLDKEVHLLNYLEYFAAWCGFQVLPVEVEEVNALALEFVGVVWKADIEIDAVATVRVLSRLLQIKNCSHFQPTSHKHEKTKLVNLQFHLLDDVILLNKSRARSLWSDEDVGDHVAVQPVNHYVVAQFVVLLHTSFAETKCADKAAFWVELGTLSGHSLYERQPHAIRQAAFSKP